MAQPIPIHNEDPIAWYLLHLESSADILKQSVWQMKQDIEKGIRENKPDIIRKARSRIQDVLTSHATTIMLELGGLNESLLDKLEGDYHRR